MRSTLQDIPLKSLLSASVLAPIACVALVGDAVVDALLPGTTTGVYVLRLALDSCIAVGLTLGAGVALAWRAYNETVAPVGLENTTKVGLFKSFARRLFMLVGPKPQAVYDTDGFYLGTVRGPLANHGVDVQQQTLRGPRRYRELMELLPVGQALCQLGPKLARGRDFFVLERNSAFHTITDEMHVSASATATQLWPSLSRTHPELFEILEALPARTQPYTVSAWLPTLGKSLDFTVRYLGDDFFAMAIADVTEIQMQQRELLRLHHQLRQKLDSTTARLEALTRTTDNFLLTAADVIGASMEQFQVFLDESTSHSSDQQTLAAQGLVGQYAAMRAMLRYASAATLNFQPELVDTAAVVHGIVAELRRRYPGVNFVFQALPHTTAAREVVQAIISLLMETLCQFGAGAEGTVLEFGIRSSTLQLVYVLDATGIQNLRLVQNEVGEQTFEEKLAGLQLAVCRRLTYYHGGTLVLTQSREDLVHIEISLGLPLDQLIRATTKTSTEAGVNS